MRRELVANTVQPALGAPWSVSFTPPSTGRRWVILSITVEIPNYAGGLANALVFKNDLFVCGSSTGHLDSADGTPLDVRAGETLTITWQPLTLTAGLIYEGKAVVLIDEVQL